MKKKDVDMLRKVLEEERTKILRHLEDLSDSSGSDMEEAAAGDPVDIASIEINQSSLMKIGKRETYLLKKMDLALSKMDEGTYGECENCGEEIGVPRLMARPVAQLCIDCKTEQENMERRYSNKTEDEDEDGMIEENEEV